MRLPAMKLFFLLLSAFPTVCYAADQKKSINPEQVVSEMEEAISRIYVLPEVAAKIKISLRENLKSGRYSKVREPEELAKILAGDLFAISKDKHFDVRYDGLTEEPVPENEDKNSQEMDSSAKYVNFGFNRVEVLQGNIGYLEFDGFYPASLTKDVVKSAMNFLKHTHSLIIDIRGNSGGDPSTIVEISNYFFKNPTHLNSFYIRENNSSQDLITKAPEDGVNFDNDIYVLVNRSTFSAAEEFAYNLKMQKRAIIVGEVTMGGAHPTRKERIGKTGFVIHLPFAKAINPISKSNWEGVGVQPDEKVEGRFAFEHAYKLALENVSRKSRSEIDRGIAKWKIDNLTYSSKPYSLEKRGAASYVGVYQNLEIRIVDSELVYQEDNKGWYKMNPIQRDIFLVEGVDWVRMEFVRDGKGQIKEVFTVYPFSRELKKRGE